MNTSDRLTSRKFLLTVLFCCIVAANAWLFGNPLTDQQLLMVGGAAIGYKMVQSKGSDK